MVNTPDQQDKIRGVFACLAPDFAISFIWLSAVLQGSMSPLPKGRIV